MFSVTAVKTEIHCTQGACSLFITRQSYRRLKSKILTPNPVFLQLSFSSEDNSLHASHP
jgi:hypothetical protein